MFLENMACTVKAGFMDRLALFGVHVALLPVASQWIHHQSGLLLEIVQCLIFG